ncbi:expressed unknown protein [Seminavis robusta]|uniref:Uncharacterized protein n=1 Tax=Seminavis robusta TaxID=568900 RepID=A0A9N8E169_9STRA|nr:expressed unknown protein [Seminavis robusta]|eukprot:Sro546_g164120.1 n/a (265) ;mRNA; f:51849-52643
MAAVVASKAKVIDKALQDRQDGGFDDVIVWPSSTSHHSHNSVSDKEAKQNEEELLLDYGYAEPSPRGNVPRRSSLSSTNDPERRAMRRASIGYTGEMTLVLPNHQVVQKRRSITFSDDDTVHSIDSCYDSDEDDEILNNKRQLWFRAEEYRHIERNIRNQLAAAADEERPTWVEYRGLESMMDDNCSVAERNNAIQSVLEDQQRQKQSGIFDEHAIATEYQYNSMDAQLVANERAKGDEKDIEGYMEKTKQVQRKFQQARRMSC